ncbi:hypothetical protein GCM10022402_37940 [Salinactinospora qingdaonensis]|uniref:Uncharacterized protein n=1 Tax=Salinactinospora qingdaonensis TaxID=702744 RepID=A0ABP7G457_9ACTN
MFVDLAIMEAELAERFFDGGVEGLAGYALRATFGGDPDVHGDLGVTH